ncbi:MAG: hypothetical protein ACEPOZ_10240 [Marinifilaceae bacterium]|jgi:hypothetical protein
MSFISNIKEKFAKKILERNIKQFPRHKEFHNLSTPKSIGILFDTRDEKKHKTIKTFQKQLKSQGHQVKSLAWVDADLLPDYGVGQQILYYCNKDLNWAGKPQLPEIEEFIQTKFDILFDFSGEAHPNLRYAANLSQAACKVGGYDEQKKHLDLMIDMGKEKSLDKLIEQSLQYLNQIKKN